jgi:hypothetical protein
LRKDLLKRFIEKNSKMVNFCTMHGKKATSFCSVLGRGLSVKIISLRGTHVGNTWFGVYLKGI